MIDHLTIHCAKAPGDILDVEVMDGLVYLETHQMSDDEACIALDRQSAQELYDLLGEFLADDQR